MTGESTQMSLACECKSCHDSRLYGIVNIFNTIYGEVQAISFVDKNCHVMID